MTVTATRLGIRVLAGGLSALMITLGALIGGAGMWLFAALGVVLSPVAYLCSGRIALRVARAQRLPGPAALEVYAATRELATRAGIPTPRLYLLAGERPNAFATGRNPKHAAVAVTEGLLTDLPLEQVRGVLAHELAHVRNRDTAVAASAATIPAIAYVLQLRLLFEGKQGASQLGLLGSLAAMMLAPFGATLMQLAVSRQREYLADTTAARLLGTGAPLAAALYAIALRWPSTPAVTPVTAPIHTLNPLPGEKLATLLSTHPAVRERIRRLRGRDSIAYLRRSPLRRRLVARAPPRALIRWRKSARTKSTSSGRGGLSVGLTGASSQSAIDYSLDSLRVRLDADGLSTRPVRADPTRTGRMHAAAFAPDAVRRSACLLGRESEAWITPRRYDQRNVGPRR